MPTSSPPRPIFEPPRLVKISVFSIWHEILAGSGAIEVILGLIPLHRLVFVLSTKSQKDRDDWIKSISDAVELITSTANESSVSGNAMNESKESPQQANPFVDWSSDMYHIPLQSFIEESVECVHKDKKTEVLLASP